MKTVSNILAHALDHEEALSKEKQLKKTVPRRPRFTFNNFTYLDDSDEDKKDEETKNEGGSDDDEQKDEVTQQEKDELLVHLIFKTELINVVVNGCMK